jgi:endonuclease/exonuclease/phosphatase family metal-dependent hydrolase
MKSLKILNCNGSGRNVKGRGGGVGFLVRKNIQARVLNSKSENLLWLVIQERLYVAVVYKAEENEDTLQELQEDVLRWRDKGEIVVMGDFNCRVGELSNYIEADKSEDAEVLEIPRCSEDKVNSLRGRNLLDQLNAVDMVLTNGESSCSIHELSGCG